MLYAVRARQRPRDIIVVHLGGNDLGMLKGVKLMLSARRDLGLILELFPGINMIWSDMLQCMVWRGDVSPLRVDKARRYVNRVVAKFLGTIGGTVISHPGIVYGAAALFQEHGVHLSDLVAVMFLTDIKDGIRRCLETRLGVGRRQPS
ncbi:ribonuclease P/MRP protein subunit POP5 [Platysternon megacephalum]|uniref:Ribonuclease P/MRP protein subunit POP5 n=1 Tax=Platysternon megacephalum TaxID=55544 RepID=A0A4D9DY02_9SAUR|nr:ribonuclease P/MRP protein subunit POP5 [Platysternon megacephalum]